ncbi:MAG: Gldg family protein [Bdellovibrionales bacterium]
MSSWGKLGLLLSGFCFIIMAGTRSILGIWHPLLYGFLALFLVGLLVSMVLDYKFYLDFLSMKTTKNSLSLGWSLMLLLILLVSFGYLSNRFNKSFDLTSEKIHSLATQSQESVDLLKKRLQIYVFFKGSKLSQQAVAAKQLLKDNLILYKQASSKVKVLYVDTYKNNKLSKEFLDNLTDKNQKEIFVFVSYEGQKVRVDEPFTEQNLTSAIIKSKKTDRKEIYFLIGHGERDLRSDKPDGLRALEQYLSQSGFALKEWSFAQSGIPKNKPPLVLVVGPSRPFLVSELNWLKKYLSQKGRLMIALDPKEQTNLPFFLKNYGVSYKNDFIVSQLGLIYGGVTKALGVAFDPMNPITLRFNSGKEAVFFEKASSLEFLPAMKNKWGYSNLVRSHGKSFVVPNITQEIKMGTLKSLVMGIEVHSKSSKEDKLAHQHPTQKPDWKDGFRLVVFGDSDFMSNRYFYEGSNRDLALNTVVSLLGEDDLVTIRPKQPTGTKVEMTRFRTLGIVLLMISLPLIFLIVSLWMWYRRREA